MLVKPGIKLETAANTILNAAPSTQMVSKCTIYSPTNDKIQIQLPYFHVLKIKQQFGFTYTDEITFDVSVPMEDFLSMLQNAQDLRLAISFRQVIHTSTKIIDEINPIQLHYRVIIANADELLKQLTKQELVTTSEVGRVESIHGRLHRVTLQLMESDIYDIRHKQFNGLLKNVTLKDTIYYCANLLGIKNISLVEPDNTRVYSSLSLPPMLDISTAFDFLQDRYGIYSKGLVYYYTNKTLYIYPGYETAPKTETVVNIYNVPENSYMSAPGYHYFDEGGNIHILCNSKVQAKNMAAQSVENNGNYKIALRTDMALDHVRTVQGDKGMFQKDNALSCGMTSNRGMVSDVKNAKYETSSNNAFKMASDLVKMDCVLLVSGWTKALPYLIKPGTKVIYHYEDLNVYTTRTGIVEELDYAISQQDRTGDYTYICNAAFALRLDPTK